MSARVRARLRHDRGASAVEYGLMVAAIAAAVVAVVFALGQVVSATFREGCDTIAAAAKQPGCTKSDSTGGDTTGDTTGDTGGGDPVPPAEVP